jgi:hypothetical protein
MIVEGLYWSLSNKTVQATPTNAAVIRCAVTPAACAALVPAPLGYPFWYGVPDLIR